MTAYYNEHDKFAAAWLRELIKAGLIADGEVDERSIVDVQPEDVRGFAQCHFFAGIGVWSYALRRAGWADHTPVWTGSCPCQSFSASGKRGGFSDSRHLWPAWFRLLRECNPDTCFGEQVASKDGLAWLDVVSADLESAGYAVGTTDLCAAGVGAPHIRQRLYFVAHAGGAEYRRLSSGRREEMAANGSSGEVGGVAKSQNQRHTGRENHRGQCADQQGGNSTLRDSVGRCGEAGGVADAEYAERRAKYGEQRETHRRDGLGRSGAASESFACTQDKLGDADLARPQGQPELVGAGGSERATSGMEQPARDGRGEGRAESERQQGRLDAAEPGFTNGFWAEAEWLPCRDGKLRPVEPGTFPLAHGSAARVGRLRGYGNALCAPAAEEFIRAFLNL